MATVDPKQLELNNTLDDPAHRSPLVTGGLDYEGVTDAAASAWDAERPPMVWWVVLLIALSLLGLLGACVNHLLMSGTGVWGNNNPVYWGWPIVNFLSLIHI